MKYYIDTIEQTATREEGQIIALTEYGKREGVGRAEGITDEEYLNNTIHKFYEKLDNVSAHIGGTHTFFMIQVIDSVGHAVKGETLGEYLYAVPEPEPEEPES